MNYKEKIKALAESADVANRLLALQLSKTMQLDNSEVAYSCAPILDKIPMLGTAQERRNSLLLMAGKSPKIFGLFLEKYK